MNLNDVYPLNDLKRSNTAELRYVYPINYYAEWRPINAISSTCYLHCGIMSGTAIMV